MPRCWANVLLLALVAALGVGAMLAGCGQKGPLYLPDDKPKPETAAEP